MSVVFGPGISRQPAEGVLLADTNAADLAPIVVQAVDSQSGNLMEFRDPSGNVLSSIDISGTMGGAGGAVILAPATTARNTVTPTADTAGALTLLRHSATQVAGLLGVGAAPVNGYAVAITPSKAADNAMVLLRAEATDNVPFLWAKNAAGNILVNLDNTGGLTLAPQTDTRILHITAPVAATGTLMQLDYTGAGNAWIVSAPGAATTTQFQSLNDGGAALWVVGHSPTQAGAIFAVKTSAFANIFEVDQNKIGCFGTAPVVKQAGASAGGIAAVTDANAKAALTALQAALAAYGLVTSPA